MDMDIEKIASMHVVIVEKKSKDIEQQLEPNDNGIVLIYSHHIINENDDTEKRKRYHLIMNLDHRHVFSISKKLEVRKKKNVDHTKENGNEFIAIKNNYNQNDY